MLLQSWMNDFVYSHIAFLNGLGHLGPCGSLRSLDIFLPRLPPDPIAWEVSSHSFILWLYLLVTEAVTKDEDPAGSIRLSLLLQTQRLGLGSWTISWWSWECLLFFLRPPSSSFLWILWTIFSIIPCIVLFLFAWTTLKILLHSNKDILSKTVIGFLKCIRSQSKETKSFMGELPCFIICLTSGMKPIELKTFKKYNSFSLHLHITVSYGYNRFKAS